MEPDDRRLRLVYDEAIRGLEQQIAGIQHLRSTAGVLVSAVTVSTGFLGTLALNRHANLGWPAWIAVGLFALTLAALGVVLWPTRFATRFRADIIIDKWFHGDMPTSIDDAYEQLALLTERNIQKNQGQLERMFCAFKLAIALTGGELITWIAYLRRA